MRSLVVIDIQREYVLAGRELRISSIGPSLNNAYAMLQFARSEGWPIVHVQHLQEGDSFNSACDASDFVDGFVPEPSETVAIKNTYSSFSSPSFVQFVSANVESEFVVVGYGTSVCCLSTLVEGYHRGHRFALVEDACAARAAGNYSEAAMHQAAVLVLGNFARLTSTAQEAAVAAQARQG